MKPLSLSCADVGHDADPQSSPAGLLAGGPGLANGDPRRGRGGVGHRRALARRVSSSVGAAASALPAPRSGHSLGWSNQPAPSHSRTAMGSDHLPCIKQFLVFPGTDFRSRASPAAPSAGARLATSTFRQRPAGTRSRSSDADVAAPAPARRLECTSRSTTRRAMPADGGVTHWLGSRTAGARHRGRADPARPAHARARTRGLPGARHAAMARWACARSSSTPPSWSCST